MNACGQHNMADIGFQGMTIRTPDKQVIPALQVLLGGSTQGNGKGIFADKVIKLPSKRGPEALRRILDDFEQNKNTQLFVDYYLQKGEKYFYNLLKDLSEITNLTPDDYIDWGTNEKYIKAIGVGECAGVMIDLVETLFLESDEKIANAKEAINEGEFANGIYHAYSALINSAKALILAENSRTNSHAAIIEQFDQLFVETGKIDFGSSFSTLIYQIKVHEPSKEFALSYTENAVQFLSQVRNYRNLELKPKNNLSIN